MIVNIKSEFVKLFDYLVAVILCIFREEVQLYLLTSTERRERNNHVNHVSKKMEMQICIAIGSSIKKGSRNT